jgi:gliding motility-associated protein GldM
MVKEGKGKELLKVLTDYKEHVLGIDSGMTKDLKDALQINTDKPKTATNAKKSWEESYFGMVPTVAALTILSKFQNDIKTSENKLVSYCHEQVGKVTLRFDAFEAIVGQNSTYLMPGQDIEITAGLGAFSKQKLPNVTINGSGIQLNDKGQALYKAPAGAAGPHTVNVTVSFTDQDGQPQTRTIPVEYTVGSANASIALDKMNVLYIGVDNPVTIAASGGGDDKVNATISSGTLTRTSAGKYIARVTQQSDDCKITVSVDGKVMGVSQFRVRQIPGAQATVGGAISGDNIPAGTFRAQGGVAAWIKDFPFDLKYTVTQFTISTDSDDGDIVEAQCTGNTFNARAQEIIRTQVKAGKTVYIDNIRVQGEDGQNKKVPSLVYYIK